LSRKKDGAQRELIGRLGSINCSFDAVRLIETSLKSQSVG